MYSGFAGIVSRTVRLPSTPSLRRSLVSTPAFSYRNLKNPSAKIGYEFKPSQPGKAAKTGETSLSIVRPPVVLVHGTYDTPLACWQTRTASD